MESQKVATVAKDAKKARRQQFNDQCLRRDGYTCRLCPRPTPRHEQVLLEVHHITNRELMPGGGYVRANGISLCPNHHLQVEEGYPSPAELYRLIGETEDSALQASHRLLNTPR